MTPRLGTLALAYVVALTLLAVGATLGYLTSWAEDRGTSGLADRLYVAHTMTMLLGFVGTTVLGTLTVLWPTMLRTKMEPEAPRWALRGLPLLVAGTALVACSGLWSPLGGIGALVYLAGAGGVVLPAWRTARRVPPTSFATASATAAVTWFLAARSPRIRPWQRVRPGRGARRRGSVTSSTPCGWPWGRASPCRFSSAP